MSVSVHRRGVSVVLASLGFSSLNSAMFAIYFFSVQGFAFDETAISNDGYFFVFPTLALYAGPLSLLFMVFTIRVFILISLHSIVGSQIASSFTAAVIPTVLFGILLPSSESIFKLDPDFLLTEGIAQGSVSPVLAYRLAVLVCLFLLAGTVLMIAFGRLISWTVEKLSS